MAAALAVLKKSVSQCTGFRERIRRGSAVRGSVQMARTRGNTMANTAQYKSNYNGQNNSKYSGRYSGQHNSTGASTMASTLANTMANTMANTRANTLARTIASTMAGTMASTMAGTMASAMANTTHSPEGHSARDISQTQHLKWSVCTDWSVVSGTPKHHAPGHVTPLNRA